MAKTRKLATRRRGAGGSGTAARESDGKPSAGGSHESTYLKLQQEIGNRATRRILGAGIVQPKLRIGAPHDRFEHEADRTADAVMRMPAPDVEASAPQVDRTLDVRAQRMCAECAEEEEEETARRQPLEEEEEEERLQPKALPGALKAPPAAGLDSRVGNLRGQGRPLPPSVRSFFEPRFGQDFRDVRVHTGGAAADVARSIDARAFTTGDDVVFGSGEYAPESLAGRRLLAHELAHVVQQTLRSARRNRPDSIIRRTPQTGPDPISKAIEVLKNSSRITKPNTDLDKELANAKNLLTEERILGVFGEEEERTDWMRSIGEALGIGTLTYGRGAIGELSYRDVNTNFLEEKMAYEAIFGKAPSGWIDAVKDKNWAVFYTAAYIFLNLARREKTGRNQDDQLKLGIAVYHGGLGDKSSLVTAQIAAAKNLKKPVFDLTWSEIEVELKKLPKGPDIIDYVDGVVTHKITTTKKDITFYVKAQLIGDTKFTVGEYGTIKVTAEADYDRDVSGMPPDKRPPPNYGIGIGGQKVRFETGNRQVYTWNNLEPGDHVLRIYNRYTNGTIPLVGKGTVEVRF